MTYRISYDDGLAATTGAGGHEGVTRTEYFRTEYEALQRARQLLEDGDHHAVSLWGEDTKVQRLSGSMERTKAASIDSWRLSGRNDPSAG
jgi:hypothetical protein